MTSPLSPLRAGAALLLALLASGCAGGWSVSAGPMVDTAGNVGLLVTGRMALGLGTETTGVLVGVEGGIGPALDAPLGVGYGASVLDVERFEDDVIWRVGIRGGWMGRFDDRHVDSLILAGGSVAVLSYLSDRRSSGHRKWGSRSRNAWAIGGELRGFAGLPMEDDGPVLGVFALTCTFESFGISGMF